MQLGEEVNSHSRFQSVFVQLLAQKNQMNVLSETAASNRKLSKQGFTTIHSSM